MKALIAWIMSWFVNLRATVDNVPQPPVVPPPTFFDDFSAGHLDVSKWIPSSWTAPGGIPGVHNGLFAVGALDFSQGCLRIKVSQVRNAGASVTSIGGELQSRRTLGFGTYEWLIRASSTSSTPEGGGRAVTGQISSGFIFEQDSGYTEIDVPEIEGQHPNQLSWTSWLNAHVSTNKLTQLQNPEAGFHSYKLVWTKDSATFLVDGVQVAQITSNVPQNPAFAMINHWGTNSIGWGGIATPNVDRYMFVRWFGFTPLA